MATINERFAVGTRGRINGDALLALRFEAIEAIVHNNIFAVRAYFFESRPSVARSSWHKIIFI